MNHETTETNHIGYWRPRSRTEHPAGRIADADEEDVRRAERGEYVSLYVSSSDIQAAGATTKLEYLRIRADRSRRRADEIWALPVPIPGELWPDDSTRLANWLDAGSVVRSYRGTSVCRVCGKPNGSEEVSRDGYIYPSGLSHYVRDHGCRVPGLPDPVWKP